MSLPKGWKRHSLDEVATIQTGVAKNDSVDGDIVDVAYLRVANVQDGYVDLSEMKTIKIAKDRVGRYLLQNGDVLLTEGGDFDKLGRGTVWQGQISPCIHQNHVFVARPDTARLTPEFLSAQTGSDYGKRYFRLCSKQSTNLASINSSQLKEFPVILPPLPEQKAIADLLSTWDKAIEKTEWLIAAKEKKYTGLLAKLYSDSLAPKTAIGKFTSEVSIRNKTRSIIQVLSVTNKNGFVLPEDQFDRQVASSDLSNYKIVSAGEYAYNPSRINVGSIARLDGWCVGVLSPMYTVFKLNPKQAVSDYFLHWLDSHEARAKIKMSAQGSVRETVNFDDFCEICIPLPSLSEQVKIAEALNSVKKEASVIHAILANYKEQKRGLMQKLLNGQWRVKGSK